jgi:histidine triad (HIT) family protein
MSEGCVFCEIVAGRSPASVVYQDDAVVAFMDIQPINPGAVVVVPRRHLPSLGDLDEDSGARLFNVAVLLQRSIRECGVRCEGINLFLSDGESAGQEVFHSHLLVVPRFAGDSLRITCDWPEPRPREELDRAAAAIREAHVRLQAQLG